MESISQDDTDEALFEQLMAGLEAADGLYYSVDEDGTIHTDMANDGLDGRNVYDVLKDMGLYVEPDQPAARE